MNAEKGYQFFEDSQGQHNLVEIFNASKVVTANNQLKGDLAGRNVVLMLMRDGCGWCQKFKPTFIQAADQNPDNQVIFAIVDIGRDKWMSKVLEDARVPLKIQGVPEVVSYMNGKYFSKFGGERVMPDLHLYAHQIGKVVPEYRPPMH